MAKIKFDLKDVDPDQSTRVKTGNYETPPVGVYQAVIADIQSEEPENKDPRLHVIVNLTAPKPPEGKAWPQLHDYITFTERSKWKLDQFLQAMGIATKSKRTGEFDDTKLKNKKLAVYLGHETDTWNEQTRTRARINNYLKAGVKAVPGAGTPSTNGGSAPAAPETDDLDTLGSAADAEDEDAQAKLTDLAESAELDPDEFDTWAELATAISDAQSEDEDEAEEEAEEEEPEEEEAGEDLDALGLAADDEDEDAQTKLMDLAEEAGLDPDEYDTWAELATAIQSGGEEGEEESEDYESMPIKALKALAKERGISPTGTREEVIERLNEYDETDPFEE